MAATPLKPCNRCKKNLTTGRYCPECSVIVEAMAPKENRLTATERGYTWTWKKIRDRKIQNNPLCERCQNNGLTVPAVLVHHVDRNPKNNKDSNHESLCLHCHQIEHRFDGVDGMRDNAMYRYARPGRWG